MFREREIYHFKNALNKYAQALMAIIWWNIKIRKEGKFVGVKYITIGIKNIYMCGINFKAPE